MSAFLFALGVDGAWATIITGMQLVWLAYLMVLLGLLRGTPHGNDFGANPVHAEAAPT